MKTLIRLGSVGLVTTIATLILSFRDPTARLERLIVLLAASGVLVALSQSQAFHDLLTPVIRRALSRTATFELRDYVGLLNLHRDFTVADLTVQEDSWLANECLGDLELRSKEGINVLGIRRGDGTYIGAPGGDHKITPGDTLIAYGQRDRLEELVGRSESDDDAHEEAKNEHERILARERRLDPERDPIPSEIDVRNE